LAYYFIIKMAQLMLIAFFVSFAQVVVANGSLRQSIGSFVPESVYVAQPRLLSSTPFQCNSTSFCSNNGECTNDKTSCKCNAFYTTFPTDSAYQCNYEQKSRLTAFLLQFFICGSGQMYLGNLSHGIPQFLFIYCAGILACFVACCCFACIKKNNTDDTVAITACSSLCVTIFVVLAFISWSLADAIMIALGQINDSNGAPTYRNM
jgi:hypothetical protein